MGQIKLTVSLVMIGLFSIAILGFAINFAQDNNSAIDLADDSEINSLYTQTKSNLSNFDSASEDTYESIIESTVEPGSMTVPSTAPFAITPSNAVKITKNIMQVGYVKIFGTGSGFGVFLSTFIGLIVFMLALYLYKTLRGMPD